MLIPVLPNIQRGLDTSLFRVGLIITAFSVAAGIAIPFGGYLSDRFGRKIVIVPGLFLFGLGGLLAGLAPIFAQQPYWLILAARVLQGIGAGGTYQVSMALAGDIYQGRERSKTLGMLEASNGLGKVAAPIIGAAAGLLFWYAAFFIYPIVAWIAGAMVWFLIQEPKHSGAKHQSVREYFRLLQNVWQLKALPLAILFFGGFLALFMLFGLLSWFSDVLERSYDINGFGKGFVIAIPVLIMAILSFITGILLQKKLSGYMKWVAVAGLVFSTAGLLSVGFDKGLIFLITSISLLGVGNGLFLPSINMLITSSVGTEARGILTSLYGTVRFMGAALGPPAFGLLTELGQLTMGLASAGIMTLALLLTAFLVSQKKLLRGGSGGQQVGSRPKPKIGELVLSSFMHRRKKLE